jgi:hypothetical protein
LPYKGKFDIYDYPSYVTTHHAAFPQAFVMTPPLETHQFDEYRTFRDPHTGRQWRQLTSGRDGCCPLYFYGHVTTTDGMTILFYRYHEGTVQNWKLDLSTGLATRLTNASTPNCLRWFWHEPQPASGVREMMTCFSPSSEEMAYFDNNTLRAVHIRTLEDRTVFHLPKDRVPSSIPDLSPCGRFFAFAHAERAWWEEATRSGPPARHEARQVHLEVVEMATGQRRHLLTMNSLLTHVNFCGADRLIFTHLPTEEALLVTDMRGGWFAALRTQTPDGVCVNHAVPTARGVFYETVSPLPHGTVGRADPETFESVDYLTNHPVHHIGHDWEGRMLFGDIYQAETPHDRHLAWLPAVETGKVNHFDLLTGPFRLHGNPRFQRNHIHGTLMPDRQNILFTGPDDHHEANHLFLLDVSDLADQSTEFA